MGPWPDLGRGGPWGEHRGRERDGETGERGDNGPRESNPGVGVMVTWLRWEQE